MADGEFHREPSSLSAGREAEPVLSLTLWPHRSLSPRGFRWVLLVAAVALAVPLIPILGTAAAWVLAGFLLADLGLLYLMMKLTYRSGRVRETLTLWPDRLRVVRSEPSGRELVWEANPYWVQVALHNTRTTPNYLVLSASGREIELGSFLTPDERAALADQLSTALLAAKGAPAGAARV